ncbi:MAG: hypothetical protein J6T92_04455 [Ottowia sp.]|nr:hypothetical protein [Ottowia sp.]
MTARAHGICGLLGHFVRLSRHEQEITWQLMLQAMVKAQPVGRQAEYAMGIIEAAESAADVAMDERARQELFEAARRDDEATLQAIRSAAAQMARSMK